MGAPAVPLNRLDCIELTLGVASFEQMYCNSCAVIKNVSYKRIRCIKYCITFKIKQICSFGGYFTVGFFFYMELLRVYPA